MDYSKKLSQHIKVTLVCRELRRTEEPVSVGLQDKNQNVHEGSRKSDRSIEFTCEINVRAKSSGEVDFFGPFVHGTTNSRFLYISWKRKIQTATPWLQRVKVPLPLDMDLSSANKIHADVTGRRPHTTEPVIWKIQKN